MSILNEAYRKLFPNEEIPILIQDAFDRAEVQAHLPCPHRSRWSLYVRFLRWLRTRGH